MTKRIYILAITFCFIQIGIVKAQSYTLDVATSVLKWTGYAEVGDYTQSGTLKYKSGNLSLDKGEIRDFKITVDMTSLTHESKELEGHLKQNDFFFVSKYPIAQITFIEKNKNTLIAEIIIRGKSQKIEIALDLKKIKEGYVLKGKIKLDRTKFDIKYNSSSYFQDLGNYAIKNDFDLDYELFFKEK